MTHTKGPWTLTHLDGNNFAVQTFEIRGMFGSAPNISPIFNKSTDSIDGDVIHVSPHDARLIAAAPELLAAAQVAFETLAPWKHDDFVWAAMSQLANAIAKAVQS